MRNNLKLLWLVLRRRMTLDEARGIRKLRPAPKEGKDEAVSHLR